MVMIRTMTTWPATRDTIATATTGRRSSAPADGTGRFASERSRADGSARAYGSGRRSTKASVNARPMKTAVSTKAPASSGSPSRQRHRSRRRDEVRAGDGADRRAPYHRADGRCPSPGRHEVGGDVATEVRGAIGESGEKGPEQQQRDRVDQDGHEAQGGADHAGRQAAEKPGPPPDAEHERRQARRRHGGAEHRGRRWHPSQRRGSRDLGGNERPDRDRGDVAGAAEGRDGEEGPQHAPPEAFDTIRVDPPRHRDGGLDGRRVVSQSPRPRAPAATRWSRRRRPG